MTLLEIAAKIPAEYRKEILSTNMIENAVANSTDPNMSVLFNVWSVNVEHGLELGCGACLERVLKNFRELQPALIQMEKNTNLLKLL